VVKTAWTDDEKRLIAWYQERRKTHRLPVVPFCLGALDFMEVSHPERFYVSLEKDIEKGASGMSAHQVSYLISNLKEAVEATRLYR